MTSLAFACLLVGGIVLLLAAVLLTYAAGRPFPHRRVYPDGMRKLLAALLKRGYDTGVLRLEVQVGDRPFIQFRKHISAPGVCGIEFGFPNAAWSRTTFPVMQEVVEKAGFAYEVRPTDSDQTTAFLCVDLGRDVDKADLLARTALEKGLGVSADTAVTGFLMGISARDERIC